MNWTVYILECADGSLYTGITKDLTRRITEHETWKGACYTAGRARSGLYIKNSVQPDRKQQKEKQQ
jgi:predicted GIY-YIG superfamily endonuclease